MARIIRKKPNNQSWEEAQRKASALGYAGFHPYDNRERSLHPYALDNPNNPYSRPKSPPHDAKPQIPEAATRDAALGGAMQ